MHVNEAHARELTDPSLDFQRDEEGGGVSGGESTAFDDPVDIRGLLADEAEEQLSVIVVLLGDKPRRVRGDRDVSERCRHRWGSWLITSSPLITRAAPSWMRRWAPTLCRLVTGPGTAITSRPSSPANPTVMSAPLRSAASTTTTPRESPAITRLRAGKCPASGRVPGANWEMTAPCPSISRASRRFSGG